MLEHLLYQLNLIFIKTTNIKNKYKEKIIMLKKVEKFSLKIE